MKTEADMRIVLPILGDETFSDYSQQLKVVCRDSVVSNSLFGHKEFKNLF